MAIAQELKNQMPFYLQRQTFTIDSFQENCEVDTVPNLQYVEFNNMNQSLNGPSGSHPKWYLSKNGFTVFFRYRYTQQMGMRGVLTKMHTSNPSLRAYGSWIVGKEIGWWMYGVRSGNPYYSGITVPAGIENVWHTCLISVTGRDVSNWDIYIDGNSKPKTIQSNGLETGNVNDWNAKPSGEFLIGNSYLNQTLNGDVDDVWIWNKILTPCEFDLLTNKSIHINKQFIDISQIPSLQQDVIISLPMEDCDGVHTSMPYHPSGVHPTRRNFDLVNMTCANFKNN